MKIINLATYAALVFFLSISNSLSKTKFEIEGFSLGMVLSDKLTPDQIKKGKIENYYNTKYVTTLEFEKSSFLPTYDWIQFSFKKKDKKQKIIDIEIVDYYEDNIAECFAKRDELISDIKKKNEKRIDYIDDLGTKPFSESYAKGTNTTTWIILKGRKYIYVSCYNFAETETRKDQLRMGISNAYFDKYAYKK